MTHRETPLPFLALLPLLLPRRCTSPQRFPRKGWQQRQQPEAPSASLHPRHPQVVPGPPQCLLWSRSSLLNTKAKYSVKTLKARGRLERQKWHGAGEALVRRHGNRDSHGEPEHPLLSVGFQSSSLASRGKQQNLLPGPCAADAPSKASNGCLGATTRAWTHPADSSSVLVGWEGNAQVPEAITDLETLLRAARNRCEHRSPSAQPHVKSRLTEL
ncbi:hypothetical protein Anapl_01564 [Anas platyrhynchos]|uniref:Uncharacterized protein n=1 Tax=Anas platyrhynchos TaxID=8839 RepID=R0JW61_ANAPL|nr:hypothetical protein Anapl_01564 [Anas platyrhynchos]